MKQRIKCLECGKKFIRPASHVWQVHNLSARDYKKLHNLDVKRGIATEEYREHMRALAYQNKKKVIDQNLIEGGNKYRFKKGDDTNYVRSEQTMKRLRKHWVENVAPKAWQKKQAKRITVLCDECGTPVMRTEAYVNNPKLKHTYCTRRCATIAKNKQRAKK